MNITRTVRGVTNRVNTVFTYSLEQDAHNPAVVAGMPSEFTISVVGTPDENGVVSVNDGPILGTYEFTELGDYKFIVRETASADAANYPVDSSKEYYFYVSVRNKVDSQGRPTGAYVATLTEQVRNHDTGDKMNAVFESEAKRSYIQVSNEVRGNLAKEDDYFKYKITINGATNGDRYTISGQDAAVQYGGETIATSETAVIGMDNFIYLKHGQTVTIGKNGETNELPIGVTYTIQEVEANGYTQFVDGVAGDTSTEKTVAENAEAIDNKVAFLNRKEADVLTGIVLDILPFVGGVAILGIVIMGAIIFAKKKKSKRR